MIGPRPCSACSSPARRWRRRTAELATIWRTPGSRVSGNQWHVGTLRHHAARIDRRLHDLDHPRAAGPGRRSGAGGRVRQRRHGDARARQRAAARDCRSRGARRDARASRPPARVGRSAHRRSQRRGRPALHLRRPYRLQDLLAGGVLPAPLDQREPADVRLRAVDRDTDPVRCHAGAPVVAAESQRGSEGGRARIVVLGPRQSQPRACSSSHRSASRSPS